jgi:5-bromo-4-chloroindolyl phosphate hydrolysis protein
MKKTGISKKANMGGAIAKQLTKAKLSPQEVRAWRKDLEEAHKTLKPPCFK